jgi:bloom syndrome protein
MALTATANPTCINDIIHQLKLQEPVRLVQSFNRSNLRYTIREKKGSPSKQITEDLKTRYHNQCGVIYCRTKKACEDLSAELQSCGIRAAYYHAGMPADERQRAAADWQAGRVLVVVATVRWMF